MNEGRRRSERYPWLNFSAEVFVKRSFFVKEWIAVVPFDYSRFGMGIQTDEIFEVGEQVVLNFVLEKEDLKIEVPNLKGVVRYKTKVHSRFDYGVEFVFLSKADKLKLEADLLKVEQLLRSFENGRGSSDP